jgi:predicted CXXCH cytochrome family protein
MTPRFSTLAGLVFLASAPLWTSAALSAANVGSTKHNLSSSGLFSVKATTETEICVFCHVPHGGTNQAALWNRRNPGAATTYTPYTSSTTKGTMGQPNGSSLLCLSCHDGTIALGELLSRGSTNVAMQGVAANGGMPAGPGLIGRDLSDDHPVSFLYSAALATPIANELLNPLTLTGKVKLDASGQMQCSSCHDAHDNSNGKFLVMKNTASALCVQCHSKTGWTTSSHSTSPASWNGTAPTPWPHTSETTVANNACENCHQPHTAGGKARLLNNAADEANCYSCHTGSVATKNIQAEINKISGHSVAMYSGIHDPVEVAVIPSRHVACADCHNPHQTNAVAGTTTAPTGFPTLPGAIKGVRGVSILGTEVRPATYEYEVCLRCHGDSTGKKPSAITRAIPAGLSGENNVRKEFLATNASFHPVAAIGKNTTVPSLISPLTTASTMTCSSCHNNNAGAGAGGTGPNGPHGSTNSPLLERNYSTADNTTQSATAYALCYKCHNQAQFTSTSATTGSFRYHTLHVVTESAPCSACHDPHGVSTNNHLINFDTAIVTGARLFIDTGANTGSCNLTCHGKNHNPFTY